MRLVRVQWTTLGLIAIFSTLIVWGAAQNASSRRAMLDSLTTFEDTVKRAAGFVSDTANRLVKGDWSNTFR
jgi:hypothetical protein